MGGRTHTARGRRRRTLSVLAALILCVALVEVPAAGAAGRPQPESVTGTATLTARDGTTQTVSGEGTVTRNDDGTYTLCLPFWAIGPEHRYEVKDADGKVIDSFTFIVPQAPGEAPVTIDGKQKRIDVDHTEGVNAAVNLSRSNGCVDDYKAPKPAKRGKGGKQK